MSLFALALAVAAVPAPAPAAPPAPSASSAPTAVAVVPLDDASARNVAARAVFDAVAGALPSQASARGLVAKRFALVRPIDEAARSCGRRLDDVTCIQAQTKRLGARFAIVTLLRPDGALEVALVDADSPRGAGAPLTRRATGIPPHVLAAAPKLVDELLEEVAPRDAHRRALALARLKKARLADDHQEAARICFELAALLPAEMASWTFDGADSLADAGRLDEARAIFAQLAGDESLDEDVRLEALARSRVPTDPPVETP